MILFSLYRNDGFYDRNQWSSTIYTPTLLEEELGAKSILSEELQPFITNRLKFFTFNYIVLVCQILLS